MIEVALFHLLSAVYTVIKKGYINTTLNKVSIQKKTESVSYLKLSYSVIKRIYSQKQN